MEEIENKDVKFWFENGILINELKTPIHITLDKMTKLIELRHQISNNTNQYWCMDGTKVKSINKEARDYAEKHGQNFIYANAAIVNSHITKFLFNTYTKLKSPGFPFQAFTNRKEAIEWLLKIKEKNDKI